MYIPSKYLINLYDTLYTLRNVLKILTKFSPKAPG